jgi:hypothetical protein
LIAVNLAKSTAKSEKNVLLKKMTAVSMANTNAVMFVKTLPYHAALVTKPTANTTTSHAKLSVVNSVSAKVNVLKKANFAAMMVNNNAHGTTQHATQLKIDVAQLT